MTRHPAQGKGALVQGRVSGPRTVDFSDCAIFLANHDTRTTLVPTNHPPVGPDGHYVIRNVYPGKWTAHCRPSEATALAAVTFRQKPGYLSAHSTLLRLKSGDIVIANFVLPAAGWLGVLVMDRHGEPVQGAYVLNYAVRALDTTGPPAITDKTGLAALPNVPLRSKVIAVGPRRLGAAWWGGGHAWRTAKTLTLAGQGATRTVRIVLPGPAR